jgi:hypothetical protein
MALVVAAATPAVARAAFPQDPPNDPLYDASPLPGSIAEQWDLSTDRGISVDRAWPLSTGVGTIIADIDLGPQLDHEDLAGRFLPGYDFFARDSDPTSDTQTAHATNVAGVLGAKTDNGIGVAGIAPGAMLLPVRTADNILDGSVRLAQGIAFAADHHADVASMSLGTETVSSTLYKAGEYAQRHNLLLVAAMGNEFHFHHEFPATLDQTIGVGGVTPNTVSVAANAEQLGLVATDFTHRAPYSDYGPKIDLVAPTSVPTTDWGNKYTTKWSGTSASTPHVAATAALVIARGRAQGISLSSRQVRQILIQTADDLGTPGWDQYFGYGRVNAFAAVSRVAAGKIPPETDITSPRWYTPENSRFGIDGLARGNWTLELGQGVEPAQWRTIATGADTGAQPIRLAEITPSDLAPGGWTLRLRATDSNSNQGEDRDFFFSLPRDESLHRQTDLRTSGESSPVLANLRGDRAKEIVLATSDGLLHVFSGRTGRDVSGFPRRMRLAPDPQNATRDLGALRQGFVSTPAVGDINGDHHRDIVVAGLDGRVYAFNSHGRTLKGWPTHIDLQSVPSNGRQDVAIYASPALADLNGDGRLDVIVGAADQKIYAWNGRGNALPGWPVLARDGANGVITRVFSSPAVGDLNGDGKPDVVESSNEVYGSSPSNTGRVYAWDATGHLLKGWPVAPTGLAADSLPVVGQGVPTSPVLGDVDGDGRDEVAVATFTGQPELYKGDGTRLTQPDGGYFETNGKGAQSKFAGASILALGANGAMGPTTPKGPLRFYSGQVDSKLIAAQLNPSVETPFEHVMGGWDATSGKQLPGFPAPVEGWTIAGAPAIADVDGDGHAEVIAPSSGYLLHAFKEDGTEPPGWPKQTGGWLLAAPAIGDVDGDGLLEVVAVTREGHLFVWDTPAKASSAAVPWSSLRGNLRNTGHAR